MSLRRVGWFAAVFVAIVLWMSCGQVYRPVVIPIANNPPNPANFHAVFGISNNVAPNPGAAMQIDVSGDSNIGEASMGINPTHAAILANNRVFVTSAGSVVNGDPDVITAFTPAVDASIATGIGNPTTFTMPNFGANQSSAITSISESGNVVTVTLASSIGTAVVGGPIVISGVIIPGPGVANPSGYDGNFTILSISGTTITYNDPIGALAPLTTTTGTATVPLPTFCSYQPDFVTSTQTTAVYVANYGVETSSTTTPNCTLPSTDSVAVLNATTNTITQIAYLPAGSHPVVMAETPNGQNLYVVNQGDGTSPTSVLNLSTVDLSTIATIPIGVNPIWIASRPDGQRVYVLTQGDGQLYTIRSDNTVASQSIGIGANYVLYDKALNRLYVTSPPATAGANGLVYVFSATADLPAPLVTPSGNPPGALIIPPVPPCAAAPATCGPVIPASVAALGDGSRFYVASYQVQSPCSDPNVGTGSCIIPMVTVYDAGSLTIRAASSSLFGAELSLFTSPPFAAGTTTAQYAVPEMAACRPAVAPAVYSPGSTRFRVFATAAADSSHVYVSICDAGAIADITTNTNTLSQGTNASDKLVTDLLAPLSAGALGANGQAPPQSPVFLLTGQ